MNTYHALIAMRKGSKRFPQKHLAKCQNIPVCELAPLSLTSNEHIESITISTDDKQVIQHLQNHFFSLKYFKRSKSTTTDNAKVETCVEEFILKHSNIKHLIFFPAANSCWITPLDIQQAIFQYEKTNANSLITIAPLKRYLYERNLNSFLTPFTIDTYRREFLGNLPPVWIENGSFYIFNTEKFLETKSFRIEPCTGFIMSKESERELDTPIDLAVINTIKSLQT